MKTASARTGIGSGWRLGLLTLVIALGGAACSVAQAQTPPGPGMAMHGGPAMAWGDGMRWGGAPGGRMHERMLDAAGANAEQKTKVREIFGALGKDMRAMAEAGHSLHQQMGQLLLAPTIDAAAVESLRQQLSAHHDAASKRVTQAMLDAAAVLTPEQRAKLAQFMQHRREMHERHQRERRALEGSKG